MLTISVAVHNNWHLTKKFLESLFAFTNVPHRIVVTDNASSDGTVDGLAALAAREKIELVRNEKNLGFSEPHRRAFDGCSGEFFAVLNNDLEVCPGWAEEMLVEFQKNEKVVQVGLKRSCCALDDDGTGIPGEVIEYLEASFMIVRAPSIRQLPGGLFDPAYRFAYYEDSDLSLRIKKAGMELVAIDLPITHLGGATARIVKDVDIEGYKFRNKHVFLQRWGNYLKARMDRKVATGRLVIRRGGARGDVIMVVPVVHALRKKYPKSVIVVSTVCTDVFDGNPDVNEVTVQGTPLRKNDLTYDLDMAYEKRPEVHPVKAYADVCGVEVEDYHPKLYPSDTARMVAQTRLPAGPKYAIIHPANIPGWAGRQWQPSRMVPVIEALRARGYKTVLVGSDGTPALATDLDFRNVAFSHLVALMERAALFVGLDSMPFHVAQACRIPALAIFGCVDPELRVIPGGKSMGVVADGVGCLGCHNWLPAPRTVTESCPRGTNACMEKLTSEDVIRAVDRLIQNTSPVV
jgi:GT2 family glycosyltransferase/ADP-heptose:LPS heptosyltransferase